jgi:hypothetical protein
MPRQGHYSLSWLGVRGAWMEQAGASAHRSGARGARISCGLECGPSLIMERAAGGEANTVCGGLSDISLR